MDYRAFYADKRILVTGASGFIGGAVCRALLAADAEVHGTSRNVRDDRHIVWHVADLAEPAVASRLIDVIHPDAIFHLASAVTGSRNLDAVEPLFEANLAAAVRLLVAASCAGVGKVVLAGSMEEPFDAEATPGSPYAAAKLAATAYGRMFQAIYGLPVVTARIFMTYGPGQADLTKLIPYAILSFLRGEAPKFSSGAREVDWVYVDDVAEGLLAVGSLDAGVYDIGSGERTSIRGIVEAIAELMQPAAKPVFGALAGRPLEATRSADAGRTREACGWHPRVGLRDGLQRTISWYKERYPNGRA